MKGCIIKNKDINIKSIIKDLGNISQYNWLITNIECYPYNEKIRKFLDSDYCWISGEELLFFLEKEDFQWIWGVFSAFPCEIKLYDVLKYDFPYADGNNEIWKNPIKIQHPLAIMEIIAWDGALILIKNKESKIINTIISKYEDVQDLEEYNKS